MNICIIEPHADDAFLSLGWHLQNEWGKNEDIHTLICTVFSNTRDRAADAAKYASAVGAFWHGLGFTEGEEFKIDDLPDADFYVLPLGIQHEEHISVRIQVEALIDKDKLWYYMDQPYVMTLKNHDEIMRKASGCNLVSYLTPHANKYKHIPIFKDQSKFFHFNPKETLLKSPEIILSM